MDENINALYFSDKHKILFFYIKIKQLVF